MANNDINNSEYQSSSSRKWKLVLLILIVVTIGTFIPPLLSAWVFGASSPLFILTGGNFVTLVTLIVSAYFGANVWQKHILKGEVTVDLPAGDNTKINTKSEVIDEIKIEQNEDGEA